MGDETASFVAQAQAIAQTVRVEAHKELDILAAAALRAPAEGDPQRRIVGLRAPVIVFANTRQRATAARRGVEVPAMLAAQHRLDITLGKGSTQFDQRFPDGETIAVAMTLHPLALVIMLQLAEEKESIGTKPGERTRSSR